MSDARKGVPTNLHAYCFIGSWTQVPHQLVISHGLFMSYA